MSRRDPLGIGFDPDLLRSLHDAYGKILAAAELLRGETHTLPDLIALASIVDDVQEKRDVCEQRLRKIDARRHAQARSACELLA